MIQNLFLRSSSASHLSKIRSISLPGFLREVILFELRHGFYYATAFVLIFCVVVASRIPSVDLSWLLPALLLGNLLLNTFYFIGGLILLEKGEGTLEAQVVTPLPTWEYLASKVGTLTLLGLVENTVIVMLLVGLGFNLLPLAASLVLTAALYCLAGVIAVVRYASINEYLMPSVLYSRYSWLHCCSTCLSGTRGSFTCIRCKPRYCWRSRPFNPWRDGR
ncbi:MAG TPA: hypothetical protein VJ810_13830 [Blastocatellia bacterium]|nr:hypothetical protein [Blastocatellia bacterium]